MKKRIAAVAGIVCLLLALVAVPLPAQAAGNYDIYSIDVTVDLHDDGSATITEVWDIDVIGGITEWYQERINLDHQELYNLTVTDETGTPYQTLDSWELDRTLEEKAYTCGIVTRDDGYEYCWGVGSYGRHQYTVQYQMSNIIKAYEDADVVYQTFVARQDVNVPYVRLVIRGGSTPYTVENTGVWGASNTGEINVVDGQVLAEINGMAPGQFLEVLVQFAEGMFHPDYTVNRTFEDIKDQALYGTDYDPDINDDGTPVTAGDRFRWWLEDNLALVIFLVVFILIFVLIFVSSARKRKGSPADNKKIYRGDIPYSRELPFKGSVPATWARLKDLSQQGNDGNIIGAYLLQWIRSRQVDILKQQNGGFFGNKEQVSIKLYMPRLEMGGEERTLYEMLVKAAGPDHVLQNKEFEKWSQKNYQKVQGWLEGYRNAGKQEMRAMGAIAEMPTKAFFGLVTSAKTMVTPLGDELTIGMLGFKKYLQDFTIINEREAREVQLWDQYLVFAQVFGIAEQVAQQFEKLYPDYFAQMAMQMGGGLTVYDMLLLNRIAGNFGHAMYTGYRAGYNAANVSRSSGGGGGMSSGSFGGGGGGGSSGGGSSGGGR
ncbi:MAG: DUF2207 domain-containing protein [Ruminococcaceae bacterium]|nr:DUF2207 domain-containing protein [Oscillospiraceae bacterium]